MTVPTTVIALLFWSGDRSPSVTSPADKKLKRTKKDIEIQIAWAASGIPIHKLKHGSWNWGKSKLKPNNCMKVLHPSSVIGQGLAKL